MARKTKLYLKTNEGGTLISLKRDKFPVFDHFLDTQLGSIQEGYTDLLLDDSLYDSIQSALPISKEDSKYGIPIFIDDSSTLFCTLSTTERNDARQKENKKTQDRMVNDAKEGYSSILKMLEEKDISEKKKESLLKNKKDFESYFVSIGEEVEPQTETK